MRISLLLSYSMSAILIAACRSPSGRISESDGSNAPPPVPQGVMSELVAVALRALPLDSLCTSLSCTYIVFDTVVRSAPSSTAYDVATLPALLTLSGARVARFGAARVDVRPGRYEPPHGSDKALRIASAVVTDSTLTAGSSAVLLFNLIGVHTWGIVASVRVERTRSGWRATSIRLSES